MNLPLPIIFIFAHQDDEYMVSERIREHVERGSETYCVYLTNGATKAAGAAVRDRETRLVLSDLGVRHDRIAFIGSAFGFPDGALWDNVDAALDALLKATETWGIRSFQRIYAMAWEGGHADHDAAHVVAIAFAERTGNLDRLWSFPSYHGRGVPGPFFRVLSPLRRSHTDDVRRLPALRALRAAFRCWRYPSQRKTWVGLFPEAFIKFAVLRRDLVQPVDPARVSARPHSGSLLYERMHRDRYERISPMCAEFLARVRARQ